MMLNPQLIHELDQVEAFSEVFAGMLNRYNLALLSNELPDELVHDLTLQYGNMFWHFMLEHIVEGSE